MTAASNVTVAVIGAGIAGLRAADVLLQHPGISVTVYEARDRVGGRVAQDTTLGFPLDLGANWIHDVKELADGESNPIVPIANETSATLHEFSNYYSVIGEDGKEVDAQFAAGAYRYYTRYLEKAIQLSDTDLDDDYLTPVDTSESLGDYIRDMIQEDVARHPRDIRRKETSKLALQLMNEQGTEVGESIDVRSLAYSAIEEGSDDDVFVANSYQDILGRISQPVLGNQRVTLHLNSPVTRIEPTKDEANGRVSINVTAQLNDSGQCSSSSFDFAIVTLPIAVLRRQRDTLLPSLPKELACSLSTLHTGRLEKVYVKFPSAFWDIHVPTQERRSFYFFAAPNYAPDTNPHRWNVEVTSLSVLPGRYAQPMLLFYLYGDCASHVVSLSNGRSRDEAHELLDEFFRPYYSRLPNYEPGKHDATGFVASNWSADPLAGGSYVTFLAGEAQGGPRDVEVVGDGWPEMNLFFAGEGTTVDGLGTTNGAYLTGEEAARTIVDRFKNDPQPAKGK